MKSKILKGLIALSVATSTAMGVGLMTAETVVASASEQVIATGKITASVLNVREGASSATRIIGTVRNGQTVNITNLGSCWDKINFNGKTGYVFNEYVDNVKRIVPQKDTSYTAKVTASALNMRNAPSTWDLILDVIPHNATVKVHSVSNGWAKVTYDGRTGYVSNQYLSKVTQSQPVSKPVEKIKIAYTTASYLNIRTSPVTGNVITSVPRNTKVEVLSVSNGWAKVKVNGRTGYASNDYLRYDNQTPAKPSTPVSTDWVSKLNVAKTTDQLVTVQATGKTAVIQFHQKDKNGKWTEKFSANGHVGYGGISSNRHEGDGSTPVGVYTFGTAFGTHENPGTKFSYHKLDSNDWWCADPSSSKFNTFQHRSNSNDDWSTRGGEHLIDYPVAYEYGLSINFNMGNKTPEKGSAIFLHCDKGGATAGCVAVPKDKMQQLLKELNPNAKIVISSVSGINNY